MAYVDTSSMTRTVPQAAARTARGFIRNGSTSPAATDTKTAGTAPSQSAAPNPSPAGGPSTPATTPDFRSLFTGTMTPAVAQATPQAPTAESVFGATPWQTSPTGIGPWGAYSYNPFYFATPQTAAKVAAMVGGTVVQSNQFTPNGGSFAQSQPNQMVRLADGRLINPGLVASFYTHGYPQSYIDQMIANEVRNA